MEIANNIAANGLVFRVNQGWPTKLLDSKDRRPSAIQATGRSKDDASRSEISSKGHSGIDIDKFETMHARLNSAARAIRVADKTMGVVETYIEKMKAELQRVLKNYPPFPPGSEERVKRLKSVNAFRKLIDQLTIPPPNEEWFTTKTVVNHDAVSAADALTRAADEKKYPSEGTAELDIHQLPENANDEEVKVFLEKLEAAREMIIQSREDLAAHAEEIFVSYEGEAALPGMYRSYGEELKSADTQKAAEIKSSELSYVLTVEPGMTLTEAQSQLLSFLN